MHMPSPSAEKDRTQCGESRLVSWRTHVQWREPLSTSSLHLTSPTVPPPSLFPRSPLGRRPCRMV